MNIHELTIHLGIGVDLPKVEGRLRIGGGYFHEPAWLDGHEFHLATVLKYIPGKNSNDALVAKLDSPISCKSIAGGTIVLEIRHQCEKWTEGGIVHIELCDFIPENLEWSKWKQGVWIEAAASYKVIDNV